MATPEYFIGAGDISVAPLDLNGDPTVWTKVGETPQMEYGQTAEFVDNYATGKTGPNLQDLHILIRRTGTLTLQLKERTANNLAMILHGMVDQEAAGSMSTPISLPTGILVGDMVLIPGNHCGISALVLKDSAG